MIYTEFATFYDQLFDNDLYDKWIDFVSNNIKKTDEILDLACGTGRLLVLMKQAGYNAIGADLSDDMLAIANEHLNEAGFGDTPLLNENMLDLSELGKFDVITCFDDSICYLGDIEEVQTMFNEVDQHLNDEGTFLFDVITPYQTDVKYPGYMYNFHDEDHAFMWTTYIGEFPHSVEHDLTFFSYNTEIEGYDEYSETHFERTYPVEEYQAVLTKAGFKDVKVTADFGNKEIDDTTTRWFFACKKG
ncbi:class I SAM-dependent DNA methyltransferase [Fructilactobacillus sp. Tb1]|uniref:class I SAM-dependent DNA methyltransferase n=1 Tax=Fructilactobacillus sp. Tb1 TaxID=3422304 RepID=UPI003D2CD99E